MLTKAVFIWSIYSKNSNIVNIIAVFKNLFLYFKMLSFQAVINLSETILISWFSAQETFIFKKGILLLILKTTVLPNIFCGNRDFFFSPEFFDKW